MNEENTKKLLLEMPDPVLGEPLEKFRPTLHVRETDARVDVSLTMGYPVRLVEKVFREAVEKKFSENGLALGQLELTTEVIAHRVKGVIKTLPNVKNVIAVASGKGGVGKSTVTANVALALAEAGLKVGVLDADIYGPSQPTMLGAVGSPESEDGVTMPPLVSHGLEINSIGFMTDPDEPVIWRGPMASGALSQLFNQTAWNHLDCLVVDLPPGTGDIQLTLAQTLPLTGAIVVTTPQDVSYIDAAKALQMFETLGIPVFGVVENMALFKCPKCGHMERIFGEGAAKKLCEKFGVTVLGELPLETEIRSACDKGEPTLVSAPQSDATQTFRTIALMTTARLALLPKDYSQVIPSVKAAPKP